MMDDLTIHDNGWTAWVDVDAVSAIIANPSLVRDDLARVALWMANELGLQGKRTQDFAVSIAGTPAWSYRIWCHYTQNETKMSKEE